MLRETFDIERVVTLKNFFTLYNPHYEENFNFTGEMHNFWECFYVIKGSARVSADEKIHNLSAGDIIFHKPMELHKFNITNKNGADLLIFSFNMDGALCEEMKERVCKLNNEQINIIDNLIYSVQEDLRENGLSGETGLVNILPLIKDKPASIQQKAMYIEQLILSLWQNRNDLNTPKTTESVLFKRAVSYMSERINTSLTVGELSAHLNISISGLKRLFTKYAGISVHKYFLSLKMKRATSMLQEGMTVCEVSDELGFSSQGYFSATYKRETGKNPSQINKNRELN